MSETFSTPTTAPPPNAVAETTDAPPPDATAAETTDVAAETTDAPTPDAIAAELVAQYDGAAPKATFGSVVSVEGVFADKPLGPVEPNEVNPGAWYRLRWRPIVLRDDARKLAEVRIDPISWTPMDPAVRARVPSLADHTVRELGFTHVRDLLSAAIDMAGKQRPAAVWAQAPV